MHGSKLKPFSYELLQNFYLWVLKLYCSWCFISHCYMPCLQTKFLSFFPWEALRGHCVKLWKRHKCMSKTAIFFLSRVSISLCAAPSWGYLQVRDSRYIVYSFIFQLDTFPKFNLYLCIKLHYLYFTLCLQNVL